MNLPHRTTAPGHAFFYFDFVDPFSYLAAPPASRLARERNLSLTLEPVAAAGAIPVRWEDTLEIANNQGVPFMRPPVYPFDSRRLMITCLFVRDRSGQEAMAAVVERLWHEVWRDGSDASDPALALRAAREAGVPEAALGAALEDPRWTDLLSRLTLRAHERGVRTIPALAAAGELFVGLDAILAERPAPHRPRSAAPDGVPDWTFGG